VGLKTVSLAWQGAGKHCHLNIRSSAASHFASGWTEIATGGCCACALGNSGIEKLLETSRVLAQVSARRFSPINSAAYSLVWSCFLAGALGRRQVVDVIAPGCDLHLPLARRFARIISSTARITCLVLGPTGHVKLHPWMATDGFSYLLTALIDILASMPWRRKSCFLLRNKKWWTSRMGC
jgi:hypothetical protein